MKDDEIEKLVNLCKNRNELNFLFLITKEVAESDSIGEGWGYCQSYTRKMFNNAEKNKYGNYCEYLKLAGINIYKLYLEHIRVMNKNEEIS